MAAIPRLAVRGPPVLQRLVDDRRQRVVVALLRSDVDAEILLSQEAGTAVGDDAVGVKAAVGARQSIHWILLEDVAPRPRDDREG